MRNVHRSLLVAATILLSACGGASQRSAVNALPQMQPAAAAPKITHVILMIQENRTFDNLFATFPNADGTTTGKIHDGTTITLKPHSLQSTIALTNHYKAFLTAYDNGKMDGFDLIPLRPGFPSTYVYQYVNPSEIKPYWTLAHRFGLADHMFQTSGSESFIAHQDLIAAGTSITGWKACAGVPCSLIDQPSNSPWGCDAPPGTVTSLILKGRKYLADKGPRPCLEYATLRDLLDAHGISWRYYVAPFGGTWEASFWNGYDSIKSVRFSDEWKTNFPPTQSLFADLKSGNLAAMSWVIPDGQNSDHPGIAGDTGPSWVAQVVNAVGQSQYWKSTAVIVVWDDWGGFYDHVKPKQIDYQGLGFRVPMLVVSPYAKPGYISHTRYELASIIKFVEQNWQLGSLHATDARAASIGDMFDFAQKPIKFVHVDAKYSQHFFETQPPSYKPVDDEWESGGN